jgi:hypothetical protein
MALKNNGTDSSRIEEHLKLKKWLEETLGLSSLMLNRSIEVVVSGPHSKLWKITYNGSSMYFKKVPKQLFLEAEILKTLHGTCQVSNVPKVIAENKQLGCFLMTDCGDVNLKEYLKDGFQLDILSKSLQVYRSIQTSTVAHVDKFIALGVPDWRLDKVPSLYQNLISDNKLLDIIDLKKAEVLKLCQLSDKLNYLCEELAAYPALEGFSTCDLSDENIVYRKKDQRISIIDFGDSAICHPFFFLLHSLCYISARYSLKEKSKARTKLIEIYFNNWVESGEDLDRMLNLALKIYPIYMIFPRLYLMRVKDPSFSEDSLEIINKYRFYFRRFIYLLESYTYE